MLEILCQNYIIKKTYDPVRRGPPRGWGKKLGVKKLLVILLLVGGRVPGYIATWVG